MAQLLVGLAQLVGQLSTQQLDLRMGVRRGDGRPLENHRVGRYLQVPGATVAQHQLLLPAKQGTAICGAITPIGEQVNILRLLRLEAFGYILQALCQREHSNRNKNAAGQPHA